jgi:hypothetical protein
MVKEHFCSCIWMSDLELVLSKEDYEALLVCVCVSLDEFSFDTLHFGFIQRWLLLSVLWILRLFS